MSKQDSLLYLDGITVSFDGFKALNNLSLIIGEGEMRAIIGPNGAGKTTMMDVITGKTRPDAGEAIFGASVDLLQRDEAEIARLGIGRKFQRPSVFESHTVWDNIELALAGNRGVAESLFHTLSPSAEIPHRGGARHGGAHLPCRPPCRLSEPWAEAVAGNRHAAGTGAPPAPRR